MSIAFSNTTTKAGLIQQIEKKLKLGDGFISGNTTRLAQWTADINLALDKVLAIIFQVGGTWQMDDTNHSDYPIITTNLNSGQRDYTFTTDGSGNLILEIYKVLVADENGNFREIIPVDASERGGAPSNYDDGLNVTGQPNTYDKLGNGIFLDPPTNYDYSNGLKIYISREGSYFTTLDTTKKAGFAGLFHSYLYLAPCYEYARDNSLKSANGFFRDMEKVEDGIREHYKHREKDVRKVMTPVRNNAH